LVLTAALAGNLGVPGTGRFTLCKLAEGTLVPIEKRPINSGV
jgi:adenylate kinase